MTDERFVESINELVSSTLAFAESPEYWREAVGSHPKYFTHYLEGKYHRFGLSKFCAFKGISLEAYVTHHRRTTDGGVTQKHISKVAGVRWKPYLGVNPVIQREFKLWIESFFPHYDPREASIISLSLGQRKLNARRGRKIQLSPGDLAKKLERQTKVGQIGEKIALAYEIGRLARAGVDQPEEKVDHVAKRNVAAGYDIWSHPAGRETRFIEVKSTTGKIEEFFVTSNEISTLNTHGKSAFIYLVAVTDIERKQGHVRAEIQDPIRFLKKGGTLKPVLFKATLGKE
jgi:hypothetical protein